MTNEDIQKILQAGFFAPSGENCQPWRIVWKNDSLRLYNLPDRDKSLYNWNQFGSLVAHGACIENINIASGALGYKAIISLFPLRTESNLIAEIKFEKLQFPEFKVLSLYAAVPSRTTNRKVYRDEDLPLDAKVELEKCTNLEGIKITVETSKEKRIKIAESVSVGDRVLFENKQLHKFFFSHILWTLEEEEQKKFGFYIKTLELPPQAEKGFVVMKHWLLSIILRYFGVTRKIAQDNAKLYASGNTTIAISSSTATKEAYIKAGRVMQQLWLTATKNGLSVQPMTAVSFFHRRIVEGGGISFSPKHRKMIEDAYEQLKKMFRTEDEIIALLRVGYADSPSARTSRFGYRSFVTEVWE